MQAAGRMHMTTGLYGSTGIPTPRADAQASVEALNSGGIQCAFSSLGKSPAIHHAIPGIADHTAPSSPPNRGQDRASRDSLLAASSDISQAQLSIAYLELRCRAQGVPAPPAIGGRGACGHGHQTWCRGGGVPRKRLTAPDARTMGSLPSTWPKDGYRQLHCSPCLKQTLLDWQSALHAAGLPAMPTHVSAGLNMITKPAAHGPIHGTCCHPLHSGGQQLPRTSGGLLVVVQPRFVRRLHQDVNGAVDRAVFLMTSGGCSKASHM